ncbi:MAG: cytochrome c peroxidase [Planctomycetota bacterium]|jgi:cytochrome c peroxidase
MQPLSTRATRAILLLALSGPALAQLGPPPVPPQNPITPEKTILGKALFWDEQLSSDSTIACGTCHIPGFGGADPRVGPGAVHPGPDGSFGTPDDKFGSLGIRDYDQGEFQANSIFGFEPQVTERLANSPIGAAHFQDIFWDGRARSEFIDPETGLVSIQSGGGLESQALGPILSSVEMGDTGRTWDDVRSKLESVRPLALAWNLTPDLQAATAGNPSYPDLFQAAFGDPAITAERIAYAIATYERTLNPDDTPFDRFMNGQNNALTQGQQQGRNAFNSPGSRCNQCHSGALFSDRSFRNLGLRPIQEDNGRQAVTGNPGDRGRFKVPSLRNVGLRERFFHNGQFTSLNAILGFYNNDGGPFLNNKDPLLNGLNVPPQVRPAIVDFLTNGLTDARVANALPPFDRPRLNSERAVSTPVLVGGANFGSGGFVPIMMAPTQAAAGDPGFRLGISQGLGGAFAALGWSTAGASSAGPIQNAIAFDTGILTLSGIGPGNGVGTLERAFIQSPALIGLVLRAQWYVRDSAASGRIARSELAEITLF